MIVYTKVYFASGAEGGTFESCISQIIILCIAKNYRYIKTKPPRWLKGTGNGQHEVPGSQYDL
jgi:hypothetical protein